MRALIHPLAVFGITLIAYMLTMPQTITLEDAGLFQMVCHLGGLAHPPGYPLFTLLCSGLVQVPGVVNGNLVSALCGALAAALFHQVVYQELGDRRLAWFAGLGWGLSATFWSQSIIIEVYTLAALMFVTCWALLAAFARTREEKWWLGACLAFGLSLSNHWPLALLSAPALAILLMPSMKLVFEKLVSIRFVLLSSILFVAGLSPYLLLFEPDPSIAVFGGVDSFDEWLRYVSRSMYSDAHPAAGMADRLQYALWIVGQSLMQMGPALAPLILLGFVMSFIVLSRSLAIALLTLWLGGTLVLAAVLGFQFTHYYRAIFSPYPIVAYAAVAIWMSIGAGVLISWLQRFTKHATVFVAGAALVAVATWNVPKVDRHNAALVDMFARTVLNSMPRNAVLFTRGDNFTGPFGYLHYVEGVRPDVELRDWDNLVFANRLSSPFAPREAQEAEVISFIKAEHRPVFLIEPRISPRINYGAYFEFDPSANGFGFRPELESFAELLAEIDRRDLVLDAHEKHFVFDLLIQYARQYIGSSLAMPDQVSLQRRERTLLLQSTFAGKLATLELLVPREEQDKEALLGIAAKAEKQMPDEVTNEALAVFHELVGRIHLMAPSDQESATRHFAQSIDAWPLAENRSICPAYATLGSLDRHEEATSLLKRFPGAKCEEG